MATLPGVQKEGLERVPELKTLAESQEGTNERISQVFLHAAAGFAISFLSAHLFAKIGFAGKLVVALFGTQALMFEIGFLAVGIGLVAAIIFSAKNSPLKNGLFGLFSVYQGLFLSPLVLINTAAFAMAGAATVVVTGCLGFLALKMKTQFERFQKILLVSFIAITMASFGAIFLHGVAGVVADYVAYVGGFALFSAKVIYDTQKLKKDARADNQQFDVINHTMRIYLDAINLMIRLYRFFYREK